MEATSSTTPSKDAHAIEIFTIPPKLKFLVTILKSILNIQLTPDRKTTLIGIASTQTNGFEDYLDGWVSKDIMICSRK